ncbi:MAG: tRNA (adenosine(37)-N6)-threonylcarbamoyltransferase complex transferase subunit TsaD [Oscillospiraceae bacterium]|nr:tRNA (adenosine(37)-N6)-threonylcarbamoyltransferase complex transferase subunit TsaD [Oscillospiraceae bacterium]MBQ3500285.1 tRNA (adenosine(37)-N6)-threonylcarbamoyltransferase complex transferase subunit TsaD [Oscillospiraceae bacterium]MBQ4546992.1 tRNA (adenosine(37)-N6)-threonylcarbamoyltransferase complex transferase subunit TsaD [Oscillospiraceae bacterium]MBQ4643489.1 tRNA (adenosine(37)-N6)-threonylcarbamoyltransferase complex transferase subunit TsaD [Oscillospiraceae bacterium]
MRILAIESSCDETAAAVIEDGRKILSSVINTQVAEHGLYGGVVPEIASRRHTENIVAVAEKALSDAGMTLEEVDYLAVTAAPGLIGALLVGVNFAKGLSLATGKKLIPVHHLKGHIAANYLSHPELEPPFLCLVVSGGHSHIVEVSDYTKFRILGKTRDDAAGEAFDKAARAMGLPYPGGVHLDRVSKEGNPKAFKLPKPKVEGCPLDMSFSGLKTAVVNILHNAEQRGEEINIPDLCASYQDVICHALVDRTMLAAKEGGYKKIVAAGGVSANSGLRALLERECKRRHLELFVPDLELCGDNAAMIGSQAYYEALAGKFADLTLNARPTMPIDEDFE